jgi:hypothetical protein
LRITRILKCLGEFEFHLQQKGFLQFLIDEIFIEKKLERLADSMTRFWIHSLKNDDVREELIEKIELLLKQQQ